MRSCKTLRRAHLGLKSPIRSVLALEGNNISRSQHVLAGYESATDNGASTDSNWTSLAMKFGLLAVASIVGTSTLESREQNSLTRCDFDEDCGVHFETGQEFTNWSSTVSCVPLRVYEPKSAQEVVRVLKTHHDIKRKIRPIGQALSPNGLGMSDQDVISLAAIDYVEVDKENSLVTVGAGAKVSTVLNELKQVGLTLQNFSSIQEQQIGGWMQVAAHGTGILFDHW
jgi:FAD binding domain